jgi:integrase
MSARAFFILWTISTKRYQVSVLRFALCALRSAILLQLHLGASLRSLKLLRVHQTRALPVVINRAEVRALLSVIRHPVRRMLLTTIYALGLRIGEGLHLETSHIDGARGMVWIRDGKGGKDRRVPLPKPILCACVVTGKKTAPCRRLNFCLFLQKVSRFTRRRYGRPLGPRKKKPSFLGEIR